MIPLIGLWLSVVITAVNAFAPVTTAPLGLNSAALHIASSARSKAALACRFGVSSFISNPYSRACGWQALEHVPDVRACVY